MQKRNFPIICQTVQMKGKAVMVKPKKQVHFGSKPYESYLINSVCCRSLTFNCICQVFKFDFGVLAYISVYDRCNYNHANYSNRCNHANCDVDPKKKTTWIMVVSVAT